MMISPGVKKESFRYAGPCPRTRESAIISLADAVESASRSMQKPTPKKIDELIEEIVKDRLNDHQLDHTSLTLSDLATIKESFAVTLRSMMHTRMAYPKVEELPEKSKGKKADTRRLSKSRKRKDSGEAHLSVAGTDSEKTDSNDENKEISSRVS